MYIFFFNLYFYCYRHKRFMKRRELTEQSRTSENVMSSASDFVEDTSYIISEHEQQQVIRIDQECQVNIFRKYSYFENTVICNRYIYEKSCEAEVQTEILDPNELITINVNKKFKDKSCGTPVKTFVDQAIEPDCESDCSVHSDCFTGFASVKSNKQMSDLAGVSLNYFDFLLKRLNVSEKCKMSKENSLFIFLVKIKIGLSFSAMSVLFSVHRTTISRIFFSDLEHLVCKTSNFVFWPSKDIIQGTLPECFKPDYSDT